jgi:hypothetical protein
MAVPTNRDAFVYCWTDKLTDKLYIGYHVGSTDDKYISSSKYFNSEYNKRPADFSRTIIANGSRYDCVSLERKLLEAVDAAKSERFYNRHNGGNKFHCTGHSEETRKKMSDTWKSRSVHNCNNEKSSAVWRGSKHSTEAKFLMSTKAKARSNKTSEFMVRNNPMKSTESIKKMLESRARNRKSN